MGLGPGGHVWDEFIPVFIYISVNHSLLNLNGIFNNSVTYDIGLAVALELLYGQISWS